LKEIRENRAQKFYFNCTILISMNNKIPTRYSTKQTCPSSFMIMYCSDRNPLPSILMEILLESCSALVDGFRRLILYLSAERFDLISFFPLNYQDV